MSEDRAQLPEDLYRTILEHVPTVTVDVLLFNKEKTQTLLFKRTNEPLKGQFFSIGGRLLKGERLLDGALRQLKRETGIDTIAGRLVFGGVQDEMLDTSFFSDVPLHTVNIFYGYILDQEKVTLDSQHSEQRWFSVTDTNLHPLVLSKMQKTLKEIIVH